MLFIVVTYVHVSQTNINFTSFDVHGAKTVSVEMTFNVAHAALLSEFLLFWKRADVF